MTEIEARPTLYKGIRMRSRLEADYASMLDSGGEDWEYEPECFANEVIQWLPDFRITRPLDNGATHVQYVEVKPSSLLKCRKGETPEDRNARVDRLLTQMSVAWASEPGAWLQLSFHTYQRGRLDFHISGSALRPWTAYDHSGTCIMPLIWPGMGQQDALSPAIAAPSPQAHETPGSPPPLRLGVRIGVSDCPRCDGRVLFALDAGGTPTALDEAPGTGPIAVSWDDSMKPHCRLLPPGGRPGAGEHLFSAHAGTCGLRRTRSGVGPEATRGRDHTEADRSYA